MQVRRACWGFAQMMAQLAGDARAGSPRASSAAAAPAEASSILPGHPPAGDEPRTRPPAGPCGDRAHAEGPPEALAGAAEREAADEVVVARFLRSTPGLPRQLVGDLLGEVEPRCLRVLDAFTRSFDFRGVWPIGKDGKQARIKQHG